jgi:hypothetical protein
VWQLQSVGRVHEAQALLMAKWSWGPKRDERIDQANLVALRLFRRLGFATDDQEAWDALPDPFVVYRAENEPGGWAWTTDPEYAESLLEKLKRTEVVSREIAKSEALAYITQHRESEVLIEPEI